MPRVRDMFVEVVGTITALVGTDFRVQIATGVHPFSSTLNSDA